MAREVAAILGSKLLDPVKPARDPHAIRAHTSLHRRLFASPRAIRRWYLKNVTIPALAAVAAISFWNRWD